MSEEKLHLMMIESLEPRELDKIAKRYLELNDFMGLNDLLVLTDGPYDSGIDIRPADFDNVKIIFQATTTENNGNRLDKKIDDDLKKVVILNEQYGIPLKVKYFTNRPLTNKKIFSLRNTAKEQHSILLSIIDGKALAAATATHKELKNLLLEFSNIHVESNSDGYFDNERTKALYDLMSIGFSTDIKFSIITSYILNHLFKSGPKYEYEILDDLNTHFKSKISSEYFESVKNRLFSEERIVIDNKRQITLKDSEKNRLENLLESYRLSEALLRSDIITTCSEYGIEGVTDKVIEYLCKMHECNYNINVSEFTTRTYKTYDLKTFLGEFKTYLLTIIDNGNGVEELIQKLIIIADKHEILTRIAAGSAYTNVSELERLQEYINHHRDNNTIFLDTNVAINILLASFERLPEFQNQFFKSASHLLRYSETNNLKFNFAGFYLSELTRLFTNALSLIPFTEMKVFNSLGGSENPVYLYYSSLIELDVEYENLSFSEFLGNFGIILKNGEKQEHRYYRNKIENILKGIDVNVVFSDKEYTHIGKVRGLIKEDLNSASTKKPSGAIAHDAHMFCILGDPDTNVNPIEPIFCTMDKGLYKTRNSYFDEFPSHTKWLMYSPTRLMDHYSMMSFQIREGSLNTELLTILEQDHKFQSKTMNLLDSLALIINNPKNGVSVKYINALAKLRSEHIVQSNQPTENTENTPNNYAVDIVFSELYKHYLTNDFSEKSSSFKYLFSVDDHYDSVIKILSREISLVAKKGMISNKLFKDLDMVISIAVENKEATN